MLSPKRDAVAAKHFLRSALARSGQIRLRVINVDGHPAYPNVIADLKRTGELGRNCRCRPLYCPARPLPVIIHFGGRHPGMLRFIIAHIDGYAALTLWLIKLAIDNRAAQPITQRRAHHASGQDLPAFPPLLMG